ncbi:MAG: TadE/TadG family type IV pilus assembly protein [Tepidisphaeraceae bacterium]
MPRSISSIGRRRRLRRGGAVLEAALVLPIILTLSFGMIEFGYFFFVKHTLQSAARDGARVGIVSSATNAKVNTAVGDAMTAAGLQASGYQVEIKHAQTNANLNVATATAQTPVKVVVKCTWSSVAGGLSTVSPWISDGAQVSGATVMVKE